MRGLARWVWFGVCLPFLAGCAKEEGVAWFREGGAAIGSSAVVADGGDRLWCVDTSHFSAVSVLRGEGMVIRKVARSRDGGVVFTDERSARTPLLRRVEADGRLGVSVPVHAYAVAPFAHGDLVAVGCRRVEEDGMALVGLFDAQRLAFRGWLRLRHGVRGAEDFYGYGDTVHVPWVVEPFRASYAYPLLLDVRTLDTAHCPLGAYLRDEQAEVFTMARRGDTLDLVTRTDQMLLRMDLRSRRVLERVSIRHALRDKFGLHGGAVYYLSADGSGLSMLYAWHWGGARRFEWIRLDSLLRVVSVRRVLEDHGDWNDGEDLSTYGRFYLLLSRDGLRRSLLFVDKRTGVEVGRCALGV